MSPSTAKQSEYRLGALRICSTKLKDSEAHSKLLDNVISVSHCLNDMFPDWYEWDLANREEQVKGARKIASAAPVTPPEGFNLGKELDELEKKGILYNATFYDFEAAKTIFKHFKKNREWKILGVAFNLQQAAKLIDEQPSAPAELNGNKKMPPSILSSTLQRNLALPATGKVLGFDVITINFGEIGHSFLCNGLEKEAQTRFNIALNQFALLSSESDAQKLTEYCNSEDAKAEPEPWYFCKVIDFT